MLVAIVLALCASTSAVPVRRLAILPTIVEGANGRTEVPRVFDELARASEMRVGVELVGYNELFVDGAETIASTVLACGSDMNCTSRALKNARIELCLRAIVNFAVSPPLISLSLIDGPGARILAETLVEAEDSAPLEAKLRFGEGASAVLDSANIPRGGRILVEVTPADARVVAKECTSGQVWSPDTKTGAAFTVPAGCYELEAARELHDDAKARADARLGETERVRLVLRPAAAAASEDSSSLFSSPLFWVIAGGVALAGGAAVLIATNPFGGGSTAPRCFCVVTAQNDCEPCP